MRLVGKKVWFKATMDRRRQPIVVNGAIHSVSKNKVIAVRVETPEDFGWTSNSDGYNSGERYWGILLSQVHFTTDLKVE